MTVARLKMLLVFCAGFSGCYLSHAPDAPDAGDDAVADIRDAPSDPAVDISAKPVAPGQKSKIKGKPHLVLRPKSSGWKSSVRVLEPGEVRSQNPTTALPPGE